MVFFSVLFLLGGAVSVFPIALVNFLRPKGDLPSPTFLKAWRVMGMIMTVVSLVELVAVVGWSTLLR